MRENYSGAHGARLAACQIKYYIGKIREWYRVSKMHLVSTETV